MKIGFIGGHGHHYLRGATADFAVASDGHDPVAAQRFADSIGAPLFDSAAALFDQFRPDIASIGAVYGFNGDHVGDALERGLPVVSDKPIAATWDQLARLRTLCTDSSRMLLTEFPFRAQPEFRAARAAVRDGDVGEIALISAQKSYRFGGRPAWYGDRQHYGGTLLWVASHAIDVVRYCSGDEYRGVTGAQGNFSQPHLKDFEDSCALLLEMCNGATAVVHADYLRPARAATHGDDRLRIAGSRGLLEVRDGRCLLTTHDTPEHDITDTVETREVHEELMAALRGEPGELYSTAESLQTAEILLRVRDSADAREWRDLGSTVEFDCTSAIQRAVKTARK